MRQSLLNSILFGDMAAASTASLTEDFKRLKINLDLSFPLMLLAARIDTAAGTETVSAINVVIREKIGHSANSEIGWVGTNALLWLIQPGRDTAFARTQVVIKGTAENIQRLCANILHVKISFVFDPGPVGWDELPDRFSQLRFIAANRLGRQPDIALAELDYFLGRPFGADAHSDQLAVRFKNFTQKIIGAHVP
jgi:two-component system response regulator YesN